MAKKTTNVIGDEPKRIGRKPLDIDEQQVIELASINCSYAEIAAVVGCDPSTLTRRFAQAIEKGREQGKESLKRAMWKAGVTNGNITMMIWLSKQMLGYTEKVEQRTDQKVFITNEEKQKALEHAKEVLQLAKPTAA